MRYGPSQFGDNLFIFPLTTFSSESSCPAWKNLVESTDCNHRAESFFSFARSKSASIATLLVSGSYCFVRMVGSWISVRMTGPPCRRLMNMEFGRSTVSVITIEDMKELWPILPQLSWDISIVESICAYPSTLLSSGTASDLATSVRRGGGAFLKFGLFIDCTSSCWGYWTFPWIVPSRVILPASCVSLGSSILPLGTVPLITPGRLILSLLLVTPHPFRPM